MHLGLWTLSGSHITKCIKNISYTRHNFKYKMHEAEEKLRKKKHMYTTVHSVSAKGAHKDASAYANVFLGKSLSWARRRAQ